MNISSINASSSSLLEMLQTAQSKSSTSGSSSASQTSSASATQEDTVFIKNSAMSKMMEFIDQLQQLSVSNPEKFKEVMADMSAQLKDAAGKATDSTEKEFLISLADSFSASAQSGKLERPEPPQDALDAGKSARFGQHPPPPPDLSQMSTETQNLMASLFGEVSKALNASATSDV